MAFIAVVLAFLGKDYTVIRLPHHYHTIEDCEDTVATSIKPHVIPQKKVTIFFSCVKVYEV